MTNLIIFQCNEDDDYPIGTFDDTGKLTDAINAAKDYSVTQTHCVVISNSDTDIYEAIYDYTLHEHPVSIVYKNQVWIPLYYLEAFVEFLSCDNEAVNFKLNNVEDSEMRKTLCELLKEWGVLVNEKQSE